MAVITVKDNGNGIDKSMINCLFSPFTSSRGAKGTGIGLSVCRTIVEDHSGKIWAEPGDGAGATFRFTLPSTKPL